MLVYRVEHEDSCLGPYRRDELAAPKAQEVSHRIADCHNNSYFHPYPGWDGIKVIYTGITLFGFKDEMSLLCWFDGWMDDLIAVGFVVRVYRVRRENLQVGHSGQVAFIP